MGKNELIERFKLLSKYDNSTTLTENFKKSNLLKEDVSDIAAGAATGAAIGSIVPGVGTAIGAGVGAVGGALTAWFATKDSGPQERVRVAFDMCNRVPSNEQGQQVVDGNTIADEIYNAIDGLGTNEEALGAAFSQLQSIADMCAVKKSYESTYGKDIYAELDSDIDSDEDWLVILRPLRNILDSQNASQNQTQPTPNQTGQGWEKYPCVVSGAKSYDAATNTYKDNNWTFFNDGKMNDGNKTICYTCLKTID